MPDISSEDLSKLIDKLHRERAIDFRGYKHTSLSRRVQRRLDATRCQDISDYIKYLDRRKDEYSRLVDSILINVTQFFRDPEAWEIIRDQVIPQILASKYPGDQIRVWSAGCASGEEAYTLAMLISDALGTRASDYEIRVYATDVDESALAIARKGEYADEAIEGVPHEMLERHFMKNARWSLKRDLRRTVIFGQHNLATDAPISHVDLIVCRNVIIYMNVELQNRILSKFEYGLEPYGFLFLGKAESLISAGRIFSPISERWRIFRKEASLSGPDRALLDQQKISTAASSSAAEHDVVSSFNDAVLRHSPSGIIAIDDRNVVRVVNPAAESLWGIRSADLVSGNLSEVQLPTSLQEIVPRVTQVRTHRSEMRFDEIDVSGERGRPCFISVTISPMLDLRGNAFGVVLAAENVTNQVQLRSDLEALNEQLQATNEELETTNEELQSTNEELETTNEELQSTNEELETTNEELQSTNEELSTTNDELAVRTGELNTLSLYYGSVVDSIQLPIVVVDRDLVVTTCNPAAEEFYGLTRAESIGQSFMHLKVPLKMTTTKERLRGLGEKLKMYVSKPVDYTARSGQVRQVVFELQPLADAQGSFRGAILIARDASLARLEPARQA